MKNRTTLNPDTKLAETERYKRRQGAEAEGGVFNRLGRKEPATSARSDSRQRSPQAEITEVEARRLKQKGTPSDDYQYSESKDSEGGHWKSKSRRQRSNTYEDDLSQPWTCEERNPFTLGIGILVSQRTGSQPCQNI
ncbi:hypothetical protein Tco_1560932 [Tanacetum coccineum]